MAQIEKILSFWFDAAAEADRARPEWFQQNDDFDNEIRDLFEDFVTAALQGEYGAWAETAAGTLALILLLDQFPRNLYRDHAKAFAGDARALALAKGAVVNGFDTDLGLHRRCFLYLPFEHSESLADQETSVALFAALGDANYLDYAEKHRDVIRRFGRFPHRNAALGRESTPEEAKFLAEEGKGF
jgi:uncharacterized protein (DUF924 family)